MIVEFKDTQLADGIRHRVSPPQPIELAPGMTGEALIDNDLVAVRRVTVQPGATREPHANQQRDLLILPRVGALTLELGRQSITRSPGQPFLVEHGTEHTESNAGSEPVEWIALLLEHRGEHRQR